MTKPNNLMINKLLSIITEGEEKRERGFAELLQVEELGEAWTQRQRRSGWRSVVPTALPGRGGEGRADSAVPGRFNVEEERGTHVEEE
jgi:hypothetical protein